MGQLPGNRFQKVYTRVRTPRLAGAYGWLDASWFWLLLTKRPNCSRVSVGLFWKKLARAFKAAPASMIINKPKTAESDCPALVSDAGREVLTVHNRISSSNYI